MQIKRLSLLMGLVATLAGCQAVDRMMGISPQPATPAQGVVPANTPLTPIQSPQLKQVASSLVIYVGATTPVAGYTAVSQKGMTVYVDPRQTLVFSDLSNALAVVDEQNRPYLNLVFSPAGAQKLQSLTAKNIGKILIMTLRNELISTSKIGAANTQGILQVPMDSVKNAQIMERRILDGE
ncbi:SecDF P1 head subdomain-containing protein [Pelistega europaea]|uniref:SecDF P1 head subdomain domain-containing protein n=1 Tax=Pelistega europaea TaxID=106147 RepID=A0A7Y4L8M7_9BURK|nr:hypothetical protein [Pelistega europaea]NOL48954.1 hypothetical protein [Pelistega europaea]